ncbi:hypothetical protein ABPG74_018424 [Tetrahymena malaccensis]
MKIKQIIIILASLPIILVFLIAIMSQYVALIYLKDFNNQIQNHLFTTQIMYSQIFSQQISFQLSQELQKIPLYIRTLNQYLAKLLTGQVKSNPKHRSSMVPLQMLHDRQVDPYLLDMYRRSRILVNCWYQTNYSSVDQMDQIGQQKLNLLDKYHVLSRAFQNQDMKQSSITSKSLGISDFFETFQYEAIYSISGVNSTLKVVHQAPSCKLGIDVRCRYWYALSAQQESVQIFPPSLTYGQSIPTLSTISCQRMMLFNQTTQKDDLQSVICIGLYFNQTQNYFQNFASSTKQVYFLEPQSQILLYNSKQPLGVTDIETLNSSEFLNLQSQNEASMFNNTLNQNYANPVFKNVSNLTTEYIDEVNSFNQTFSYDRNGTQTIVIMNPVYVIDKSPQFQRFLNNEKSYQYQIKLPYVQINIISNENLKNHAQQIEDFFQIYFLAFNISFSVLGIISILVIVYYTHKIKNIFYISINQLTDILVKMNDKELSQDIFDIITAEEQLSLDTSQLYDSLKMIYQIMLCSSDDFYSQNDTEQLLKLNKNIEFFKQFGNLKAVGITFNNIGSILLKQGHYFQALENFQSSVIYAKYEIQEFYTQNPNFTYFNALQGFSYLQQEQHEDYKFKKNKSTSSQLSYKNGLVQQKIRDKDKSIFSLQKGNNLKKIRESQIISKENIYESKLNYDLKEQAIELLNNLYQRERNFIISLLALQEYLDSQEQIQQISKEFNFWTEIKKLCKNLIEISKHMNQRQQIEVEIKLQISRCYFSMNKHAKSQDMLFHCRKQLQKIFQIEQDNMQIQIYPQSILNFNERSNFCNDKQSPLLTNKQSQKFIKGIKIFQKNNQTQISQCQDQKQQKRLSYFFQKDEEEDSESKTYNQLFLSNQFLNANTNNFHNDIGVLKDQKILGQAFKSNQQLETILISSIQRQCKLKDALIKQNFLESSQQQDLSFLENLFEFQRNLEQDQQAQEFFNNYFSHENLDLMLNLAEIDYFKHDENFYRSADILTKIFEEKKRIMSHYKYKIIDLLHSIFKSQKIESYDVNFMKQNLRNDLGIHISMIFTCQFESKQMVKQLQVASNLVSKILTKKGDQISITLINKYDNFIQTYLPLIEAYKIKNIMGKIIKDIIQLIAPTEEFSKILIAAYEKLEDNQLTKFQNNNEVTKKMLQSDNSKQEIQNMSDENDQDLQEGQIHQNVLSFCMNSNTLEFPKRQLQISQSYSNKTPLLVQKSIKCSKKIEQSFGDDLYQFDEKDYFISDSTNSDIFYQKNYQFHFIIRKVITQFIQNQQLFQASLYQQNANFSSTNHLKYIIYCTDSIQIFENEMFKLLCKLLVGLKIKLIILAQQKGSSFIEKYGDQIYVQDIEQVIMVFYEPQQVLNYINNLRCQFNKKVYPTIIQNH